jgi:hypothetical protein
MSDLLNHNYNREVYIKGYKKTNIYFLKLNDIKPEDDHYKIIGSKIDNIGYRFLDSTRIILFDTCFTWNCIVALETFYNISTVNILYKDDFFNVDEIITQIKIYLSDTIRNLNIRNNIANAISFKTYFYSKINLENGLRNFKKIKDSTKSTIFGVNLSEGHFEYLYEYNFNDNMSLIEDYYQYNFEKKEENKDNMFQPFNNPFGK